MYVLEFIYLAIFCWCRLFEGIPIEWIRIEWIRTEVGYAWRHTYWWDTYWVDAYTPTIFRKTLWRKRLSGKKNVCCANILPWKFLHFTHTSIWSTGTYSQHHWLNLSEGSDENQMICWTIGCDVVILQTACDFFKGWQVKGDRPDNGDFAPCSTQTTENKFKGWQDHVPFISRRGLDLPSLTMQFTCNQSVMTWWQEFRFQTIADLRLRGRSTARWRDGSGQPP